MKFFAQSFLYECVHPTHEADLVLQTNHTLIAQRSLVNRIPCILPALSEPVRITRRFLRRRLAHVNSSRHSGHHPAYPQEGRTTEMGSTRDHV